MYAYMKSIEHPFGAARDMRTAAALIFAALIGIAAANLAGDNPAACASLSPDLSGWMARAPEHACSRSNGLMLPLGLLLLWSAGYAAIDGTSDEQAALYYAFFEAQDASTPQAPLLLWVQVGRVGCHWRQACSLQKCSAQVGGGAANIPFAMPPCARPLPLAGRPRLQQHLRHDVRSGSLPGQRPAAARPKPW